MEKTVQYKYLEDRTQYLDFNKALISMLNCERHLEAVGFKNETSNLNSWVSINFEDGSRINHKHYNNSHDKDNLLEQIILRKGFLKIESSLQYGISREIIINNYLKKESKESRYNIALFIEDITKESFGFFRKHYHKAERFAVKYWITLWKEIINEEDSKRLDAYSKELSHVVRIEKIISKHDLGAIANANNLELAPASCETRDIIANAGNAGEIGILSFTDPWGLLKTEK